MLNKIEGCKILIVLLLSCCAYVAAKDLPDNIKKCTPEDNACILRAINDVISYYPQGNSDFNIPSLKKISLKNVQITHAKSGTPIELNFVMPELHVHGVDKAKVTHFSGMSANLDKADIKVQGIVPNLTLSGTYKSDGKVLLLPINGEGAAFIELTNVRFSLKIKLIATKIENKHFVKFNVYKADVATENLHIELENLIKGSKEISDSINKTLNENWTDLWSEILPGITESFVKVFEDLTNAIVDGFPYEDFFILAK